jgi:hypothetical protein
VSVAASFIMFLGGSHEDPGVSWGFSPSVGDWGNARVHP